MTGASNVAFLFIVTERTVLMVSTPLVLTAGSRDSPTASRAPHKRGTLMLDAATGMVVRWDPFGELSSGRKLRLLLGSLIPAKWLV